MSETLRGGANAIHVMLSFLMAVTTSDEERERLVELVEGAKESLESKEESEEARKQFNRTIDLYLQVLKEWPSNDGPKTDEP